MDNQFQKWRCTESPSHIHTAEVGGREGDTQLREFKVRNELVVILACLYVVYALFSGAWVSTQWNFAFALLMLAGGAYAYSLQQIGGGDLKLLTVAFLWTGPWLAAPFVILLLVFILVYYLVARLGFAAARRTSTGLRIPLAPSLAGALIGGAYRGVCIGSHCPAHLI